MALGKGIGGFQSCDFIERFLFHVCHVVLNQGCCGTCQYNLLDRMLQRDLNTTLKQGYVIIITLVSMHIRTGDQYLHLFLPEIVGHEKCYISHGF